MMMLDVLAFALFFGVGVVFVLFPAAVVRFYKWFHGPSATPVRQLEPRHARNAGVVWLILMAFLMYATGFR